MQARGTDKVTAKNWIIDGAGLKVRSVILWKTMESELQGMV